MTNFKTKIAILVISFVSFLGVQSASAQVEGFSIGVGMNYTGFYGVGKETTTSSGDGVSKVTEEAGAFDDTIGSVFVEYAVNDQVSVGLEYIVDSVDTPENKNVQQNSNGSSNLTNTVKASFEDHTTFYANFNMPGNTYAKVGLVMVDVSTEENLATGGAYPDVDTHGLTLGLGYNHSVDNGVFVRAEITATQYDDVSTSNSNETDKKVSVSDMMSATAGIKIGKTF